MLLSSCNLVTKILQHGGKGPQKELPCNHTSANYTSANWVRFCKMDINPFRLELLCCSFSNRDCIEEPKKDSGRGPERPLNAKWRVMSLDSDQRTRKGFGQRTLESVECQEEKSGYSDPMKSGVVTLLTPSQVLYWISLTTTSQNFFDHGGDGNSCLLR